MPEGDDFEERIFQNAPFSCLSWAQSTSSLLTPLLTIPVLTHCFLRTFFALGGKNAPRHLIRKRTRYFPTEILGDTDSDFDDN